MMMNMFSIFDPSSSFFSSSWVILFAMIIFIPTHMWKISSNFMNILNKVIMKFKNEVSFTLNKKEKGTETMVMLTFISIIVMNFLALYPHIFSLTSHLCITLPLSLIYWSSIMMFGWMKTPTHMLSHLVPQGTPAILMVFMVIIELVSNIIRPITLCVRLTANLIAGHLLMALLGNALMSLPFFLLPFFMLIPLVLTVLESAVAVIQAYVFMTLITLYITELK